MHSVSIACADEKHVTVKLKDIDPPLHRHAYMCGCHPVGLPVEVDGRTVATRCLHGSDCWPPVLEDGVTVATRCLWADARVIVTHS